MAPHPSLLDLESINVHEKVAVLFIAFQCWIKLSLWADSLCRSISHIIVSIFEMAGKRKAKEKGKQPATGASTKGKTKSSDADVAEQLTQDVSTVSSHSPTQTNSQDASEKNASESHLAVSSVSPDFPAPSSHPVNLPEKTDNVSFVSADSTCSPSGLQIGPDNALTRRHHGRCQSPPTEISTVSTPKSSQPPISATSRNHSFYSEKDQSVAEQTTGDWEKAELAHLLNH